MSSEGHDSATRILRDVPVEVVELYGEEAAEAISDFAALELVPIPDEDKAERMRRAGFSLDSIKPSRLNNRKGMR